MGTKNLQDDICEQADIGFSKQEIEKNLVAKGYDQSAVKEALANTKFVATSSGQGVSTKTILISLLLLVLVIFRVARFANNGGVLAGISAISGFGVLMLYLARRK